MSCRRDHRPPQHGRATYLCTGSTARRPSPGRPGLHVVATPIGNLGDVSLPRPDHAGRRRSRRCEDTRVTKRATRPLRHRDAAHRLSRAQCRARCGRRSWRGSPRARPLALVSDAGTPLVSDPGFKLVRRGGRGRPAGDHRARRRPPSSPRWSVAGLPTDRFFFEGFLPPKHGGAARSASPSCPTSPATLVFFESAAPRRGDAGRHGRRRARRPRRPRWRASSPRPLRPCAAARWSRSPPMPARRSEGRDRGRDRAARGGAGGRRRGRTLGWPRRSTACRSKDAAAGVAARLGLPTRETSMPAPSSSPGRAAQGGERHGPVGTDRLRGAAPSASASAPRRRAAWLLRLKGYRILARRYRCQAGEADIVARRGAGARLRRGEGARRASRRRPRRSCRASRARIAAAARAWLARHPASPGRACASTPSSWRRAAGRGMWCGSSRWISRGCGLDSSSDLWPSPGMTVAASTIS